MGRTLKSVELLVKFFTAWASGATMKQAVAVGSEAAVGDAPGKVEL
jgi:hypothetical protein